MKSRESRQMLARLLKSSRIYFILCIAAGVIVTGCELLIPQILRVTVDSVIGTAEPDAPVFVLALIDSLGGMARLRADMWLPAALLAGAGLVAAIFRYLTDIFNSVAGERLVKTGRDELFSHIQSLPWSWHSQNPTGDIIQRCTSDIERIKIFFQEQFVAVFRIALLIVLSLACMAAMNLKLSLVAFILFPIIILYSFLFHRRISERFTDCDENEGELSTIAQENLTGVRVVRAFGREEYERRRFEAQNEVYTTSWITLCRTLANFWAVGDLTSFLQVMLVVIFGSVLCVRGEMSAGEFISFAFYNAMLVNPVRQLGRMISEMSKAGVSVSRIAQVLNAPPEADRPGALEKPMDGDIEFKDVSFRYGDGPEVLHSLSFTVPRGTSFGILGGTGSGKSTLLHLLCRLYEPGSGRICIGGEDIADMPLSWVRRNVGIVLQEPFLFSRTVGENIGVCGADAESVRAAAVTACIGGDIERFKNGFDTMVGERGVTLSGGQMQRVAIARTLTMQTPIIVFDDSLSAVDTETDERIRAALSDKLGGVTRLIVSHRITTLMDCDRILVLEGGRMLELGTPAELLASGGLFSRIYQMQTASGEEDEP